MYLKLARRYLQYLYYYYYCYYYYYYYIHLMAFFSRTTRVSQYQKGKPIWILLEQEVMGWQWHQLNHMQIICTLLQTDNHASTSPLSFYRPDALPAAQPTASKHWRRSMLLIHREKWRHISVVAIRSPFCGTTLSYCVKLSGEDLLHYSNKLNQLV